MDILIVEDNDELAEVLLDFLVAEGYEAEIAGNGYEALELFSAHSPRLVILDIMLPGMDGFTVCTEIRRLSDVPVIIVSGSGNQGMCTSVPVIVYAKEKGIDQEQLYRALILADLSTIYQKKQIGRLSAYCGAVCAGASAGAGIAFLDGGNLDDICHTIVNALAITSGIICDGAKASCAAKILVSVNAGILGYQMYQMGNQFYNGEGIVSQNIDKTIQNVGKLAREGMKTTDEKIIHIMIQNEN